MRASPLALQRLVPRDIPARLTGRALSEALHFRLVCMGAWMRVSVLLAAGEEHLPTAYGIMTSHLRDQLNDKLWEFQDDHNEHIPSDTFHPEAIRQQVRGYVDLHKIQDEDVLKTLEDAEELQECIDAMKNQLGDIDSLCFDPLGIDNQFCDLRSTVYHVLYDADIGTLVRSRDALRDRSAAERIWQSVDEATRRTYRDERYTYLESLVMFTSQALARLEERSQRELERDRRQELLRVRRLQEEGNDEEPVAMYFYAMRLIPNSDTIKYEEPESLPKYLVKRRNYENVWEILFSHGKALVEIGFTKQQRKGSAVFFQHPGALLLILSAPPHNLRLLSDHHLGRLPLARHQIHGRDVRSYDHQKLARLLRDLYGWTLEWFGVEDEGTRAEKRGR
ncbi:hypothetical protein AURDEDRAFT_172818 [Auricularia subglabra TFB-10046 SS5]|nr:hypothetical protein AURDEDRAFT_172818 [Auricularia subglabra TFB-10046 SS5]